MMLNTNRSFKWSAVRLLVVFILMGGVAFFSYREWRPPGNGASAPSGDVTLQVRSIRVTKNIALGSFVIRGGSNHEVKLPIDDRMREPHLTGHFHVQSGSGIPVRLLDEDQYSQLQKDAKSAKFVYSSEKATDGDLDATFPHAGLYYLIFDNSSESASVTVEADVTLHYETVNVDSSTGQKK